MIRKLTPYKINSNIVVLHVYDLYFVYNKLYKDIIHKLFDESFFISPAPHYGTIDLIDFNEKGHCMKRISKRNKEYMKYYGYILKQLGPVHKASVEDLCKLMNTMKCKEE